MQLFPMIRKASRGHMKISSCANLPTHSAGISKLESLARPLWGTGGNHLPFQGRGIHMLPGILSLLLIRADASLWRQTGRLCSCQCADPSFPRMTTDERAIRAP